MKTFTAVKYVYTKTCIADLEQSEFCESSPLWLEFCITELTYTQACFTDKSKRWFQKKTYYFFMIEIYTPLRQWNVECENR